MTRRSVAILSLAFAVWALVPALAPAHYTRLNYDRTANCGRYVDPVSVVFQGTGATTRRVGLDFVRHTRWDEDDLDSLPFGKNFFHNYKSPGHGADVCRRMSFEWASAPGVGNDRSHARFFELPHRADNGLLYVFATPHVENWIGHFRANGCGFPGSHAVEPSHVDPNNTGNRYYQTGYSGFDHGRDDVVGHYGRATTGHHSIGFAQWTNTRSFKQCNGWWSGKGGSTAAITIGRSG